MIESESVVGKPRIVFAVNKFSQSERVLLKFYKSRECFENSLALHSCVSSDYVCQSA